MEISNADIADEVNIWNSLSHVHRTSCTMQAFTYTACSPASASDVGFGEGVGTLSYVVRKHTFPLRYSEKME